MRCLAFLIEAPMTPRKIDTASVEIHPTAARERIAKVVLDDLGRGFAHSEKTVKYSGRGAISMALSALALERQKVIVDMVRQLVFAHQRQ